MQRAMLVGVVLTCALGIGVLPGCSKRSMTPAEQAADHVRHARWEEAIAVCDQILAASPQDLEILATRGVAYTALEQWDKAIADYTTIIESQPDDPDAYYRRAVTYDLMGEKGKALEDRLNAQRRDPMANMMATSPSVAAAPAAVPAEFADAEPDVAIPPSMAAHDTHESQQAETDAMAHKIREHLEAFDEEQESSTSLTLPGSIQFTEMLRSQSKAIATALGGPDPEEAGGDEGPPWAPQETEAAAEAAQPAPRWEIVSPGQVGSPAYATGQYKNIGSVPAYPVQTGISSSMASPLGSGSLGAGGVAGSGVPGAAVPGVAAAYPTTGVSTVANAPANLPYAPAQANTSTVGIGMGGFGLSTGPAGAELPVDATSGQFRPSPIYAQSQGNSVTSTSPTGASAARRVPGSGPAISRTSPVPSMLPDSYLANPAAQFGRPILPSQLGQGPAPGTSSFVAPPGRSEDIPAGLPADRGAGLGKGPASYFPEIER